MLLTWSQHSSQLVEKLSSLLSRGSLLDITLAAEGRIIRAHRIVLAAASAYFEELLFVSVDQHPVVYFRDVSFVELENLVQFIYTGNTNVKGHNLKSFLALANSLGVEGFMGPDQDEAPVKTPVSSPPGPTSVKTPTKRKFGQDNLPKLAQDNLPKFSQDNLPKFGQDNLLKFGQDNLASDSSATRSIKAKDKLDNANKENISSPHSTLNTPKKSASEPASMAETAAHGSASKRRRLQTRSLNLMSSTDMPSGPTISRAQISKIASSLCFPGPYSIPDPLKPATLQHHQASSLNPPQTSSIHPLPSSSLQPPQSSSIHPLPSSRFHPPPASNLGAVQSPILHCSSASCPATSSSCSIPTFHLPSSSFKPPPPYPYSNSSLTSHPSPPPASLSHPPPMFHSSTTSCPVPPSPSHPTHASNLSFDSHFLDPDELAAKGATLLHHLALWMIQQKKEGGLDAGSTQTIVGDELPPPDAETPVSSSAPARGQSMVSTGSGISHSLQRSILRHGSECDRPDSGFDSKEEQEEDTTPKEEGSPETAEISRQAVARQPVRKKKVLTSHF